MHEVIKTTEVETLHGLFVLIQVFESKWASGTKILIFVLVVWILT